MKTIELQMEQILSRAERVRARRRLRQRTWICAGSMALTLALLAVVSAWLPRLTAGAEAGSPSDLGSLILGAPALGYVLVGLLCFAFGAETSLLFLQIRRWKERGRK